jgi:DNA-binding NarL/FixJ family response regulator
LRHLFEGVAEMVVIGECEDSGAVAASSPIRMPPSDQDEGMRLAARLRETDPALAVIVLSTYAEVTYALTVVTVSAGGSVTDPTVGEELVKSRMGSARSRLGELTPRELETLALVAEGRSNADIAEALVLTSPRLIASRCGPERGSGSIASGTNQEPTKSTHFLAKGDRKWLCARAVALPHHSVKGKPGSAHPRWARSCGRSTGRRRHSARSRHGHRA